MAVSANNQEIRKRLSEYTPGSTRYLVGHGYRRVCVQLFGMAGHGKSSLINSCVCVMYDKEFENVANAGKSSNPITMERREFKLQRDVCISDNRGVNKLTKDEYHEVTAQLCKLRSAREVNWDNDLEHAINNFLERLNNPPTEIIVPVLVCSAAWFLNDETVEQILPFLTETKEITGIFPIIVLTKYKNMEIQAQETLRIFKNRGANHVIHIENYTTTDSRRNLEKDTNILKFVEICLEEADRIIFLKLGKSPLEDFLMHAVKHIRAISKREIEKKDEEIEDLEQKINEHKASVAKEMEKNVKLKKELAKLKTKMGKS
ncbi:Hypothetical predicted protein [Pelobates cultripes]|uniref:Uncharacterized protein n=1 Tax=Pelobates cultripes TaxID=61616 RepID=A0AAD1WIP2_PELCU|nr:Hypothetical predicted protein [Pelobates cultripes]